MAARLSLAEKLVTYMGTSLLREYIQSIIQEKRAGFNAPVSRARRKYDRTSALVDRRNEIRKVLIYEALYGETERKRAVATITLLMLMTGMRVGQPGNTSGGAPTFGASTLLGRHVTIEGDNVRLEFRGKAGTPRIVEVEDGSLARALERFTRGKHESQPIFGHIDRRAISRRLKAFDPTFKSKDMRTAVATKVATEAARSIMRTYKLDEKMSKAKAKREARALVARVVDAVADKLGNEFDIAEQAYINPAILEGMLQHIGFGRHIGTAVPQSRAIDEDEATQDETMPTTPYPILVDLYGEEEVEDMVQSYVETK